jgi:prepilin signal peptidase PulO-like enzyme (type II secretory pathway)
VIALAAFFAFIFGLVIGSFLNVVIYRYNTGVGVNGRSGCMTCGHLLRWYELIPLISFLLQGGRCRKCKSKLSWQYPMIELLTGLIFLGVFMHYASLTEIILAVVLESVIMAVSWSILVVILAYDIKHKIIPDGLVYTFAALSFIHALVTIPTHPLQPLLLTLAAGPALFLPFFVLWFVSQGRWIGLGDGKLVIGFGWMLGFGLGVSAVVLAFWIGAAVVVLSIAIARLKIGGKQLTMKSEIPFAPFLILGFALVYFFGVDVVGLHSLFAL